VTWLSAVIWPWAASCSNSRAAKASPSFFSALGGEFFDEEFDEQVVGGHGKKSKGGRVRANVSMGESVPRLIAQGTDD